jgi:predicted Zn finger-like uncharacterized protein
MIIACPSCSTRFKLDAARIPSKGAKVRCASCGHVWLQRPEFAPEPTPAPKPAPEITPAPKPAPVAAPAPVQAPVPHAAEPFTLPEPRPAEPKRPFELPSPRAERAREQVQTFAPSQPSFEAVSDASRGLGRWALRAGWALLLALVLGSLIIGYFFRLDIVRSFPKTAALYGLVGLEVNIVGIDFRNVAMGSAIENGKPSLQLEGEIVNRSGHRVAVPELRASLRDANGRELSHWTFEAFADSLGPREVSAFASPHVPIPAGAKELELRFATAK